mmetsp:Transcript_912/g.1348  ORF Transcript_912/g.1348 Transcript_912/m.1348 type:complete len:136 (+) Transcript_912:252-659(+)
MSSSSFVLHQHADFQAFFWSLRHQKVADRPNGLNIFFLLSPLLFLFLCWKSNQCSPQRNCTCNAKESNAGLLDTIIRQHLWLVVPNNVTKPTQPVVDNRVCNDAFCKGAHNAHVSQASQHWSDLQSSNTENPCPS